MVDASKSDMNSQRRFLLRFEQQHDIFIYLTTKEPDTFSFPLTRKIQTIDINENVNCTCKTSYSILKENLFIWYEMEVKTSKMTFYQNCHRSVCLKGFFRNLFMFVRPTIRQTKVHFNLRIACYYV